MWHRPGAPLYNLQRKGEGEQGEMWDGVDEKAWNGFFGSADEKRKEIMGDEPHWCVSAFLWTMCRERLRRGSEKRRHADMLK